MHMHTLNGGHHPLLIHSLISPSPRVFIPTTVQSTFLISSIKSQTKWSSLWGHSTLFSIYETLASEMQSKRSKMCHWPMKQCWWNGTAGDAHKHDDIISKAFEIIKSDARTFGLYAGMWSVVTTDLLLTTLDRVDINLPTIPLSHCSLTSISPFALQHQWPCYAL